MATLDSLSLIESDARLETKLQSLPLLLISSLLISKFRIARQLLLLQGYKSMAVLLTFKAAKAF